MRMGFLQVPESLSHLQVLTSTPILLVSGGLFIIEFFADKIPLVDSIWDAIHTFIRPLGAAILAASALGTVSPQSRLACISTLWDYCSLQSRCQGRDQSPGKP